MGRGGSRVDHGSGGGGGEEPRASTSCPDDGDDQCDEMVRAIDDDEYIRRCATVARGRRASHQLDGIPSRQSVSETASPPGTPSSSLRTVVSAAVATVPSPPACASCSAAANGANALCSKT